MQQNQSAQYCQSYGHNAQGQMGMTTPGQPFTIHAPPPTQHPIQAPPQPPYPYPQQNGHGLSPAQSYSPATVRPAPPSNATQQEALQHPNPHTPLPPAYPPNHHQPGSQMVRWQHVPPPIPPPANGQQRPPPPQTYPPPYGPSPPFYGNVGIAPNMTQGPYQKQPPAPHPAPPYADPHSHPQFPHAKPYQTNPPHPHIHPPHPPQYPPSRQPTHEPRPFQAQHSGMSFPQHPPCQPPPETHYPYTPLNQPRDTHVAPWPPTPVPQNAAPGAIQYQYVPPPPPPPKPSDVHQGMQQTFEFNPPSGVHYPPQFGHDSIRAQTGAPGQHPPPGAAPTGFQGYQGGAAGPPPGVVPGAQPPMLGGACLAQLPASGQVQHTELSSNQHWHASTAHALPQYSEQHSQAVQFAPPANGYPPARPNAAVEQVTMGVQQMALGGCAHSGGAGDVYVGGGVKKNSADGVVAGNDALSSTSTATHKKSKDAQGEHQVLLIYGYNKNMTDAYVHNSIVQAIRVVNHKYPSYIRRVDVRPDKKSPKKKFAVVRIQTVAAAAQCIDKLNGMCLPSGVQLRVPSHTLPEKVRGKEEGVDAGAAPICINGSGVNMSNKNYVAPSKLVRGPGAAGQQGVNSAQVVQREVAVRLMGGAGRVGGGDVGEGVNGGTGDGKGGGVAGATGNTEDSPSVAGVVGGVEGGAADEPCICSGGAGTIGAVESAENPETTPETPVVNPAYSTLDTSKVEADRLSQSGGGAGHGTQASEEAHTHVPPHPLVTKQPTHATLGGGPYSLKCPAHPAGAPAPGAHVGLFVPQATPW